MEQYNEYLQILNEGVDAWNRWRRENPGITPHLEGAPLHEYPLKGINFSGLNLKGIDLRRKDLSNSDLSGSNLSNATLLQTNLKNTSLNEANLSGALLSNANLSGADLRKSTLDGVNFRQTIVEGAKFQGAKLFETIFANVDLSEAEGLTSCKHEGPSIIDHRTLRASKTLPAKFLYGVGLQDWQIEAARLYDPRLSPLQITDIVYEVDRLRNENPVQVHNLFISYTHKDAEFIDHLESHLIDRKILFWRDLHDATAGPLEKIVLRAMSKRTVLLVLSERSVESDWVEFEVKSARELEKEQGQHVLCPIALDDAWKSCNWSGVIRNQMTKYNILDFSDWKDEHTFNNKFELLIKGLDLFYRS